MLLCALDSTRRTLAELFNAVTDRSLAASTRQTPEARRSLERAARHLMLWRVARAWDTWGTWHAKRSQAAQLALLVPDVSTRLDVWRTRTAWSTWMQHVDGAAHSQRSWLRAVPLPAPNAMQPKVDYTPAAPEPAALKDSLSSIDQTLSSLNQKFTPSPPAPGGSLCQEAQVELQSLCAVLSAVVRGGQYK